LVILWICATNFFSEFKLLDYCVRGEVGSVVVGGCRKGRGGGREKGR